MLGEVMDLSAKIDTLFISLKNTSDTWPRTVQRKHPLTFAPEKQALFHALRLRDQLLDAGKSRRETWSAFNFASTLLHHAEAMHTENQVMGNSLTPFDKEALRIILIWVLEALPDVVADLLPLQRYLVDHQSSEAGHLATVRARDHDLRKVRDLVKQVLSSKRFDLA